MENCPHEILGMNLKLNFILERFLDGLWDLGLSILWEIFASCVFGTNDIGGKLLGNLGKALIFFS